MKTYTIKHSVACYVTFVYRVEAESEGQADEIFYNSRADFVREEVGDEIGWIDHSSLEITEGDPEAKPELKEAA